MLSMKRKTDKTDSVSLKRLAIGLFLAFILWLSFALTLVYAELVVYETAEMDRHNAYGNMLGESHQRSLGYANELYWVFYASYGTGIGYATSPDGENFTEQSIIHGGNYGRYFDLDFVGTDLHMAYGAGGALTYRKGILNANSTITWYASEQTITTVSGDANEPSIEVDANGYVYIGFRDDGTYDYPYVVKSGNNDGTWGVTPTPFPYKLSNTNHAQWRTKINCVGSNTVVSYSYDGSYLYARLFNGTAFGAEDATIKTCKGQGHDAIDNEVDVVFHFADSYDYLETAIYDIEDEAFRNETTVIASASAETRPQATFDTITKNIYVFYSDYPTADHFYYKVRYPNATYTAGQDFGDDAGAINGYLYKSFTHTMGDYGEAMGFAYTWKNATNEHFVKFIGLDFIDREYTPPPPPIPSWLDLYFRVGYGMAGVILMLVAPSWLAIKVRSTGWGNADETIIRAVYALILFAVGFCLVISWLGGFA